MLEPKQQTGAARGAAGRLRGFIAHEATGGLVLAFAALLALVASNTAGLDEAYHHLLEIPVTIQLGSLGLSKHLLHWVNDGLMTVFFFLVGLEIKREAREGHLSTRDQVILPALAAAGGMAAPAAVYCLVNITEPELLRGWAIPAATDIAFALGALALAGQRVPLGLKVFLLTLATLDDLGAILIIALFYTAHLSPVALLLAGLCLAALVLFNRLGITRVAPYLFVGLLMWSFVLESGVHATLSGVALALTIPLRDSGGQPLIARLEEGLHPYVKFAILPLFAFANSGISFAGLSADDLTGTLPLGIALGLLIGKPIGVFATVWLAVKSGLARLPQGANWSGMFGVACLAGIGFTMSLFIGMLAFPDPTRMTDVRLGVIAGSILSAVAGYAVLTRAHPLKRRV